MINEILVNNPFLIVLLVVWIIAGITDIIRKEGYSFLAFILTVLYGIAKFILILTK